MLRMTGEIDLLSRPVLEAALRDAIDRAPTDIVVDLSGVTFCCFHGYAALADTGTAAAAAGTGYALSGLPPQLERHARMVWADRAAIRRYRSTDVAATTIRARRAADPVP